MASRTASLDPADPDATEFVRFCYRRRRVGWPELYDDMCAVAARGLYRGMCADDLAGLGIGLSLFDMPALASLATKVIAEEQAKRRPVAVAIVAEPTAVPVVAETANELVVMVSEAGVEMTPVGAVAPAPERREERVTEREIDVPIRLAPAPAGA
jgi:hypothetical protein